MAKNGKKAKEVDPLSTVIEAAIHDASVQVTDPHAFRQLLRGWIMRLGDEINESQKLDDHQARERAKREAAAKAAR